MHFYQARNSPMARERPGMLTQVAIEVFQVLDVAADLLLRMRPLLPPGRHG